MYIVFIEKNEDLLNAIDWILPHFISLKDFKDLEDIVEFFQDVLHFWRWDFDFVEVAYNEPPKQGIVLTVPCTDINISLKNRIVFMWNSLPQIRV